MKTKKIGIVTMLYGTHNYGGCLQAYALTEVLNKKGYCAEQILVDCSKDEKWKSQRSIRSILLTIKNTICHVVKSRNDYSIRNVKRRRVDVFQNYIANNIRVSTRVYTLSSIDKCISEYNCFITGSDQVWHPSAVNRAYLLEFVPDAFLKMSYAASLPISGISDEYASRLREDLKRFTGISVRERSSIKILTKATGREDIVCCVDPVFLLSQTEWNAVCCKRMVADNYIFCYFLGNSSEQRILAKNYAESHHLKIVTFPYLLDHKRECDDEFGDIKFFTASPLEFLTLIRDAKLIMTDSFHASAFSVIFQRQFIVFNRDDNLAMSSRILQLLTGCNSLDRFCDTKSRLTCQYIDSITCKPMNIQENSDGELSKMRSESIKYLCEMCNKSRAIR